MKTKEMIELLETCNPDAEVLVSRINSAVKDIQQLGSDLVIIELTNYNDEKRR